MQLLESNSFAMLGLLLHLALARPATLQPLVNLTVNHNKTLFEQFKKTYGVVYASPAEEASRYETFLHTLTTIAEMNAEPTDHAVYGVTKWADRTPKELREKSGKRHRAESTNDTIIRDTDSHGLLLTTTYTYYTHSQTSNACARTHTHRTGGRRCNKS